MKWRYFVVLCPLLLLVSRTAKAAEVTHDLSVWGMFAMADWVVKSVMLGLLLASLITWTIWLVKSLELRKARRNNTAPLRVLGEAASLEEVAQLTPHNRGMVGDLIGAAQAERQQSRSLPVAGIKERLAGRLACFEAAETRRISRAVGVLASVGATAPFVGLFGTVWGIMNSFIGIAASQTTNLAVVAPGIAEALLATALGLVAAIPAVLMYNHFARKIADYRALLSTLSAEVMRLVSLELDREAHLGWCPAGDREAA